MVMGIFRHSIKSIEGLLKCTIVKHAKYSISILIDDNDIVIISKINHTINFTAIALRLCYQNVCTIVLLSLYTISLYTYYVGNIIKLLCLLQQCLCAMKHDTINELFLVSYTMTIQWNAVVIYSWYLISKKLNFNDMVVNIIRNYSALHLLHSTLSSISQCRIRYSYVAKRILLPVVNINKAKFKVIILPRNDTFLNGYTNSVWLFSVTWLYAMMCTSAQIMVLNIFLYICIYCIVCYNMCSQLLSLKYGKFNNARTQCTVKRTAQIIIDKKAYCILSWSISICFIYIVPIYHRDIYLFRLLIYG